MFTLNKDKIPVSINNIKTYNKEIFTKEIYRFNITNIQLV